MHRLPVLRATRSFLSLSSLWLAFGCVIPLPVGDGAGIDSDGASGSAGQGMGSDEDSASSGITTTGASSGNTTTGASGSEGADTGAADTSSGGTGEAVGSVCDPQPEGIGANLTLLENGHEPLDLDFDEPCDITSVEPIEDGQAVGLQCATRTFELELDSPGLTVTLPLSVGQGVRLRAYHFITPDGGRETYIALSEPEGPLLLGSRVSARIDDHADAVASWFAPLSVQVAYDVCELEPYVPPPEWDGTFIDISCGFQYERLALDVTLAGGGVQRVFDDTRVMVSTYDVLVPYARLGFAVDTMDCPVQSSSDFESINFVVVGSP